MTDSSDEADDMQARLLSALEKARDAKDEATRVLMVNCAIILNARLYLLRHGFLNEGEAIGPTPDGPDHRRASVMREIAERATKDGA